MALGEPKVDKLLSRLTAKELKEWELYAQVEPFGYPFLNYMMGKICSVLAELQRDKKKKSTPYKPSEFMHRPISLEEKQRGVIGDIQSLKG